MPRLRKRALVIAALACTAFVGVGAGDRETKKSDPAALIAAALSKSKMPLADAIRVAASEKDAAGSIVLGIELEEGRGHPKWEVALLKGERVRTIAVDAVTGKSLGEEHGRAEPGAKVLDAARRIAGAGKMSVARALDCAAPRINASKTYQISIRAKKKSAAFDVNFLSQDSKPMQAQVDAETGDVLTIKPIGRAAKKSGAKEKDEPLEEPDGSEEPEQGRGG